MDWFSPQTATWFSLLSLTASIAGLDYFARRGQLRGTLTAVYAATALAGLALLAAGLYALVSGQPWHVSFALAFPGAIIMSAFAWALLDLDHVYREAELRRSVARDI